MRVEDVVRAYRTKLGASMTRSGDHVRFYIARRGRTREVGKLSHSWRGHMNDHQITLVARGLALRRTEFQDFVDCPLSAADALDLWENRRPPLH
jgi:hypothetical protein